MSQNYEQLDTEVFEIIKGDVKTSIICKFNTKGYIVSYTAICKELNESEILTSLKEDLHSAIDKEDYEEAKTVQEKINKIRELESQKPTL